MQGGREILEQKGEVGQALFSASLGSHRLHAVLGRLDEEADGLFRPRGSNQTINSALKIHADLKKEIKDRSLSSREWDERRLELARTHSELEQIQATLSTSRVDLNRLKRMQRVLPKLARRRELRQQIESLGDVVILTRDFGERRLKATGKLETAQVIHKTATARLESLQVQIQAYSIRPEVLEHSEWIENLQERLGSHRKAMQDRPHLDAEYKQLLRDIESLLKQLRPDLCLAEIGILRGVIATSKRISELGKQYSVSISRVQGTEKLSRETQTQLHEAQTDFEKLAAVVIPDAIGQAVVLARKSGDLDRAIQTSRRDVNILKEQCETDLARLSLWTGSLEEISRLPVPNRETINRFEAYYAAIDQRIQRLRDKKDENTDALRNTIRRLGEIQLAGQIPIEEELIQARTERDQVWRLLRRQWIDGEDVTAQARAIDRERALPEAFEDRLSHADELADRLRREADRVHAKASLMAEQANAKQRAEAIEQQIDECAAQKQQMDEEWGSLWAPCQIQPQAPREMRAWLDTLESLRSRIEQSNTLKLTLIDSENARATQIQAVKQSLQSLGKDCPAT
ncbi:MAG: AAA family ATPase, partial [Methylococcales bacterium]